MLKNSLVLIIILLSSIFSFSQSSATISGRVRDTGDKKNLSFVNIIIKKAQDSVLINGSISDDNGQFVLNDIPSGNYVLEISFLGYNTNRQALFVGSLTPFLDLGTIDLTPNTTVLNAVVITGKTETISDKMEKKTFLLQDNVAQSGGSVLQAMQNLPSVTVQDGKVQLRGNDRVSVLIDGKQTALTGFGNQSGLDNIPASAIERIEIIQNPSAKYDANGNGGIINIIYKKNKSEGWSGKLGLSGGLGALWIRKENLPDVRPQYMRTPKVNPSLALNYRKDKLNAFVQADFLYTETLNKNEFVTRYYDNGDVIAQQLKRNRNTAFTTIKAGVDYNISKRQSLTVSGMFGSEKIIDNGDQPFFQVNSGNTRNRLWQFLEDELKTTYMATAAYQYKFTQPGHLLNIGFNYTFHREDEKYFYTNTLPTSNGTDAFRLLSDEQVYDFNIDYTKPLKYGRIELGAKLRERSIPTNMQFIPGTNSVLDVKAGGVAVYKEIIPALYANYILESKRWEAELGLRAEYVGVNYQVDENHNTYKSDGYNYTQPFPNTRLAYKINDQSKISFFYNRRVDRPNEVDIRVFPKYDDAEIIKVGNPTLRPQFTNTFELGYKTTGQKNSLFVALYHKAASGTITRLASTAPNSPIIYAVFQNVNNSYNSGIEGIYSQDINKAYKFNLNINAYRNQIDAFSVTNLYPTPTIVSSPEQSLISGNVKLNNIFTFSKTLSGQLSLIYLAPDLIPQGTIDARYSVDAGIKKLIQKGKGELFINANDLFNTMLIKKRIQANGFYYTSSDYYETQVIRAGYTYKF